jgi:hypothetical protein
VRTSYVLVVVLHYISLLILFLHEEWKWRRKSQSTLAELTRT